MTSLDVTDCRLRGDALRVEIVNRVKDTQRLVLQPLPDMLILSRDQYEDLEHDASMLSTSDSKDRLYNTGMNVMELKIVD
jgi:hypothetical protein